MIKSYPQFMNHSEALRKNRHLRISWNSDSISTAASSAPKIGVVVSDREVLTVHVVFRRKAIAV
ncbi:hypothetical protein [Anabaena lutea]|uniref:Uncharacterized protein n=1 Tax=Anabaena lutea FACHB-196 TaxID=2692881 RepID=A0ABR8FI63_9NOST|nr:hypothetical protein [Anabaena lutea]MBD2568391.1 hypothetical protein [Anabaena lutea FACHB-196]